MSFKKPSAKTKVNKVKELERKIDAFGKNAPLHTSDDAPLQISPDEKPNKGFTIPLNEYELGLLRKLQKHEQRSMRVIARRIFKDALYQAIEELI